jgi:hypothetical protein
MPHLKFYILVHTELIQRIDLLSQKYVPWAYHPGLADSRCAIKLNPKHSISLNRSP